MGWLRRRPVHANGHAPEVRINVNVDPSKTSLEQWDRLKRILSATTMSAADLVVAHRGRVALSTFRRPDRHADDNYAGVGIGHREVGLIARAAREHTGRPQRIHDHPAGHLCSAMCSILDDPQEGR